MYFSFLKVPFMELTVVVVTSTLWLEILNVWLVIITFVAVKMIMRVVISIFGLEILDLMSEISISKLVT